MSKARYVLEAGTRFGKLTILEDYLNGRALCRCDCGGEKEFNKGHLKAGNTISCGCEQSRKRHGLYGTGAHNSWAQMLSRCRNPKCKWFHRYGGRGIQVCERWLDFQNFYDDMGEKPRGLSLDRIDNDGNYEPSNCRWATRREQILNRGNTVKVEYGGRVMPLLDLTDQLGLRYDRVLWRLNKGYPLQEAISPARFKPGPPKGWSNGH